ncbi:UDP-N-acetylglucosamine 2-epimerase [Caenimonas terrae]|uniref:UDP-N-acetylglucosamine 2-epimerase n=1 Tax=Caenimonas terrae TaxID=696074 RepID=A0ABW0NFT7_9BURK
MAATRRIAYLTGTRADFGLMAGTLKQLHQQPDTQVSLLVTGMHLSAEFGMTVDEVEALGLPIAARIALNVDDRSELAMAQAVGQAVTGIAQALAQLRPDLLLLLGDRGEMLAGAIAALHLGIPVAHLHGGERSGTVDEPIRHAITKLSHLHLVGTEESRARVVRMGEQPHNVFIVGAPSLDDVIQRPPTAREQVLQALGVPQAARYALVLFHPVVQEAGRAQAQVEALVEALRLQVLARGMHVVWLAPNADAGSASIVQAMQRAGGSQVHCVTHLPRDRYLDALACADVLVGNSSSGIIEAASFGTPVVNIGNRQRLRQRNANTVDCEGDAASIGQALAAALQRGRFAPDNVYGDGRSGQRIAALLATVPLPPSLLDKSNAY